MKNLGALKLKSAQPATFRISGLRGGAVQIAEPSDLSVRRVRNGEVRRGTHAILEHTQPLLPIKPRWEIDCACKEAIGGRLTQDSVTRHSMKRFKCFHASRFSAQSLRTSKHMRSLPGPAKSLEQVQCCQLVDQEAFVPGRPEYGAKILRLT